MSKRTEWSGGVLERRHNKQLRDAFEGIFRLLGSSDNQQPDEQRQGELVPQMYHFVRECFPVLTGREVHTLVTAAQRTYVERYLASEMSPMHPGEWRPLDS